MFKNLFYASVLSFSSPISLYALGLGEMKVESSLDQPFKAKIDLIDIRSVDVSSIKVSFASPENAEKIGIEPVAVWDLLQFKLVKSSSGKWVIELTSTERISDPYIELVIDMAWPKGQMFKAYTVLLDPPGYQLQVIKAQSSRSYYHMNNARGSKEPGVITKEVISSVHMSPIERNDAKPKTTYGPTVDTENVWQIAQRYKTSAETLVQVVLAIVGSNPQDFTNGNLNGLKSGVYLVIPSTQEILQVPKELAIEEVMAHDNAWNDKTYINHILTPPYIGGHMAPQAKELQESYIPPVPKSLFQIVAVENPEQIETSFLVPVNTAKQNPVATSQADLVTKAQLSITTAAIESMRESHAMLMDQLRLVQEQNKKLQELLDKKQHQLEQAQMQILSKQRTAIAGAASSILENSDPPSSLPYFILLLIAVLGGGVTYWYLIKTDEPLE